MYTTYHTVRERNWVSPDALNSATRAAVRTLRMASPTDQLEKKWQPPPSFRPTPRTVTDDPSTSSADDPVVVHAVSAAGDGVDDYDAVAGLAPGRSPCLTPRLVPTMSSPSTPSTLIATPERGGHSDEWDDNATGRTQSPVHGCSSSPSLQAQSLPMSLDATGRTQSP
eukprot:6259044-Pyramimonas_sp.AAC.1